MKKIVHSLLTGIILVSLASCTFFQKKQEPVPQISHDEVQPEKKTGTVNTKEDLGLLTAASNFVLVSETGEKTFIDSVSINLKKYQKRRVEVMGTWNDEKTVFVLSDVTALGNETQLKTPYQNAELGLKFQYPSIWSLKEQKNVLGSLTLMITPYDVDDAEFNSVDRIVIDRSENSKKLSPREWLFLDEKYKPTDTHDMLSVYQQSAIGGGQLDSVKRTSSTGDRVEFFVARDVYMYHFAHTTVSDSDKDTYRNAFYDLIASFEFIPFGSAANAALSVKTSSDTITKVPAVPLPPKVNTAPTLPPATPPPAPATTTDNRQLFIAYIKANINVLAPEPPSLGGTWSVTSIQFAYPEGKPEAFTGIYVVYEDGHDLRKILLSVSDQKNPESVSRIAYFKPGETTDWQVAEGTDTSKSDEKSFVSGSGTSSTEVVVKSGMQLLTAKSFKISIQYPAKWYWAFVDGGYNFSTKPVTADNVIMRFVKGDGDAGLLSMDPIGGRSAFGTMSTDDDHDILICVIGKVTNYCLGGKRNYQDMMISMLATLQE